MFCQVITIQLYQISIKKLKDNVDIALGKFIFFKKYSYFVCNKRPHLFNQVA
jgi:hypothetical protein